MPVHTCVCFVSCFAGESSTQVSPFLPGGVSDGNWHTVHIHYYNKVGFTPLTIYSSDCLDSYSHVVHSVSGSSLNFTFYMWFFDLFGTFHHNGFWIVRAFWIEVRIRVRFCFWSNEGVCLSACNSCILTAHLLYFTSSSFILLSQLHAMWVWMCVRGHIHFLCFFFPLFPPFLC